MNFILTHTWQRLRNNWILLHAYVLFSVLMLLVAGGNNPLGAGNMLLVLGLVYLQQAFQGGWLNQMKVILRQGRKATWDDFLEGVALYFWPLILGTSMMFLWFFTLCIMAVFTATLLYGEIDPQFLEQIAETWQAQDQQSIETLMQSKPAEMELLMSWAQVGLIYLGLFLVGLVLISFWKEYCVLGSKTWVNAWKCSTRLVLRQTMVFLYLGLIWLLPTALLRLGMMSANPVLSVLSFSLDIFAKTYFTLLFCQFMLLLDRETFDTAQSGATVSEPDLPAS